MTDVETLKDLKHNLAVNLLDGAFFGFAIGLASFSTIIPLFVSTMTDSAILIGLIPAIHSVGWQFPQLLTANRVSRLRRYKSMVLMNTIHERLPFMGLAVVAWFQPRLGSQTALLITFLLLIWQGLGGGFTATGWQSMIGKIIPAERRGTFFGAQSSFANLLASLGAIIAGFLLEKLPSPQDYMACFLLAAAMMAVSWISLAQTREPDRPPVNSGQAPGEFWKNLGAILRRDANFRWFLAVRLLSQLSVMAFAFYTVYAVRHYGASELEVGYMTAALLGSQIVANPVMGWLGDRWSHRGVMEIGILSAGLSALLAWLAPSAAWFYAVFTLAGIANVAVWTVALAMILEFGTEADRPAYIGLANTLIAPMTILAPFLGGFLADSAGYPAAFLTSAFGAGLTLIILHFSVKDPRRLLDRSAQSLSSEELPSEEAFGALDQVD